jgi:hypothetical protein
MMDESNGSAPPAAVLAGHLVLYPDAVAFRPDGAPDEAVIVRPLIPMARDQLVELLSPGDGGMLASVMNGQLPKPKDMRAARAAMQRG